MIPRKGYKANITSNLVNQILHLIIGAATSIIASRVLGPQGMGYVAYAILIFTILGNFGHFGLNNAVIYFKKRKKINPTHLNNVNVTLLILFAVAISSVLLVLRSNRWFLSDYNYLYILGGIIYIFSDLLFTHYHSWFVADELIRESNRFIITAFFIKSAIIILLWLTRTLNPLTYFYASVLGMLINAIFLGTHTGEGFRHEIDLALLKAEYSYGGIIFLAACCDYLHLRVDQLMIKQMLGTSFLGVYSIAVTLAELMFLLPASINTALLGKLYNTDEKQKFRQVMAQTYKLTFWICCLLAVIGIPLSLLIPFFYGKAFAGAIISTQILLIGTIFSSCAQVSMQYFFSTGKPQIHLLTTSCSLLINIALNLWLIPLKGITGAAIASCISYFIYGLFYLIVFIKKEEFSLHELLSISLSDLKLLWSSK